MAVVAAVHVLLLAAVACSASDDYYDDSYDDGWGDLEEADTGTCSGPGWFERTRMLAYV